MRLPSAAIVSRGTQLASYGQAPAALHSTPLRYGEERLGELIVGLRHGESRLDPADERLLGLLAAPIAVAAHASELAGELSQSRERVISGREEERRRLRRDLHDGLGPVLTGVVLNAEASLRLLRTDPARSETLLGELRDQTTGALEDSAGWSTSCGRPRSTAWAWQVPCGSTRRCCPAAPMPHR